MSTGRICDEYRIWGGGSRIVSRPPPSVSLLASGTTEEKRYFEWFMGRTANKLPGTFFSSFWSTLLFQASLNDLAVLHAVLALSSVHKDGPIIADVHELDAFTLQQYVKAIGHLQAHFSVEDRASCRVAVIMCIVFICLESLRGHFNTAQIYLQKGLKILEDMRLLSSGANGILLLKPGCRSTADRIVEALSRLHLQVELFKHAYHSLSLVLQTAEPGTTILVFQSINEAWLQMDRLLNLVFHLTHLARQQALSECGSPSQSLTLLVH